jgi:hypothetical protein
MSKVNQYELKAEYISSNTKSGFKVGDSDEGAEFG